MCLMPTIYGEMLGEPVFSMKDQFLLNWTRSLSVHTCDLSETTRPLSIKLYGIIDLYILTIHSNRKRSYIMENNYVIRDSL